jgi:hypothetical protein
LEKQKPAVRGFPRKTGFTAFSRFDFSNNNSADTWGQAPGEVISFFRPYGPFGGQGGRRNQPDSSSVNAAGERGSISGGGKSRELSVRAPPRLCRARPGERSDEAISQLIDEENDSVKEKGNQCDENQIASSALMKIQNHQSLLAMTRFFVNGRGLEIGDSLFPIAVFFPELGVDPEHFLLAAGERTAQAVIFVPVAVVEHIHVDLPH